MTSRSLRSFWLGGAPLTLAACTDPGPVAAEPSPATPLGIDLGSSPTRGRSGRSPGEHHPTRSDPRFGRTASLAGRAGENASAVRFVFGIRSWF
jgi:hypothetical protein